MFHIFFQLYILIYADLCMHHVLSFNPIMRKKSGSDCRPTASMESKGLIVARFPHSCTSHSLSTINLPFNAVPVIIDLIGQNLRQNFCLLKVYRTARFLVLIETSNEQFVCATNHSQSFAFRFDIDLIEFSARSYDLPNACDNAISRDNLQSAALWQNTEQCLIKSILQLERKNFLPN